MNTLKTLKVLVLMMTDKLTDIFNLPQTIKPEPQQPATVYESKSDSESDYELARNTLRNVVTKGAAALDDIIMLARSSEHPRSYEVAGQVMKTLADVSKDLLALQKQKQEIDKPTAEQKQTIEQQNNIVFAGSTEDLLKMINKQPKQIDSSDNTNNQE